MSSPLPGCTDQHGECNDCDADPEEASEKIEDVLVHGVGGAVGKEVDEDDDRDRGEETAAAFKHLAVPDQSDEETMEEKDDKKDNGKEKDNNKYKTLTRSSKTSLHLVLRSLLHKISLLPTPAPSDISFCFFGDNLPLHRSKGNRPRLCQSLTSQNCRHFPKAQ